MNEAFGWLWVTLGFASGAILGLFFHRGDWLGGYDSFRRRLVRLGHISFLGLGILNILFAQSLPRASIPPFDREVGSWAMLIGGVSMPLCCGLTAYAPRAKPLFVVPVASLVVGAWTMLVGLYRAGF